MPPRKHACQPVHSRPSGHVGDHFGLPCLLFSGSLLPCLFAEVIKYGLIRDAPFFEWLEQNMDKLLQRDPEVTDLLGRLSCVCLQPCPTHVAELGRGKQTCVCS